MSKSPPHRSSKKAAPKSGPIRARFATEYLVDLNATQAALRCGYSAKTAYSQGGRLLKDGEISRQISAAMAKREEETGITAARVLTELGFLGFSDMANYLTFRDDGEVNFDWSALPEGASRAIAEVTQETFMDGNGEDAREVRRTKFKLHPKVAALNLIAQHLGMLVQKHEHSGKNGGPIEMDVADARAELKSKLELIAGRRSETKKLTGAPGKRSA